MKEILLEADKVNVYYGDLQVLWDVSLKVFEGEIIAIIGANGAGKSTLLKSIVGLHPVKSGNIRYFGKSITNLPTHEIVKSGISMVLEERGIFSDMTVLQNLKVGAYVIRNKRHFRESLEWVYNVFPILRDRKDQIAGSLSGGEQRMLAIARGLILRPRLIMLDEPSLGLAPVITSNLLNIIKKIGEEGVTIILVEQNIYHALKISDRGYVLKDGKIALEGISAELLQSDSVKRAYLGY